MKFFLSTNLLLLLLTFFIILSLLVLHLVYGCCTLTITNANESNKSNETIEKEFTDSYQVYQAKQAQQANKYCPENHFYMPDTSLTHEEIKFIAERGGNNL